MSDVTERQLHRMADWLEADANWGHLAPALRESAAEVVRLRAELSERAARPVRLRPAVVPPEYGTETGFDDPPESEVPWWDSMPYSQLVSEVADPEDIVDALRSDNRRLRAELSEQAARIETARLMLEALYVAVDRETWRQAIRAASAGPSTTKEHT